jgi:multidrug efflux pump subunit AcrA (membrane-fusion protein)
LAFLDTTDLRASYNAAVQNAASDDARTSQTQYQAQLNIGQGNDQVRNAQAALLQAQQTLKLDQLNLTRYQNLLQTGYVSQQQVDQQRTMVHNDQQQERSAQASLQSAILNARVNGSYQKGLQAANVASSAAAAQSAHAQAAQIQASIDKALIVSPVDGVVVNRNLNPGQYPGSQTIFTIQQLDPVYAELNASSEDVFRIRRGAPVSISVAGVPGAVYRGRISAVLGQVEPGSTNFTVQAILSNPGLRLKSGMAVTGTVSLPSVSGIGVPVTAFLDDAHDSVMVVDSGGVAKMVRVKEKGNDGKTSVVTGLTDGARVVANGQLGITAGQKIAGSDGSL